MSESSDGSSSGRGGTVSGAWRWVLIEADRWLLVAAVSVALFGALVVLGALDPVPLSAAIANADPVATLFQAMVTAIVTGVTLVVSINQVVLSQELGPVGDQRERVAGAIEFRRDVEDHLGDAVSPVEPAAFFREMAETTRERAATLEAAAERAPDGQYRQRVRSFVEALTRDAAAVSDGLADAEFGTFDVLYAALQFDYSMRIYEGRRIQADHGDELDESAAAALAELQEILGLFGPAREHFKTLYFEWELINLSRAMLYTAMPALVVAVSMVVYGDDPGSFAGTTLGVNDAVWVVSAAATVGLLPFVVLLSFVLRIVTVAQRTLAAGPFVLQETESVVVERE